MSVNPSSTGPTTVIYQSATEETWNQMISEGVKAGIQRYEERLLKDDIRSVKEWAELLGITTKTLIKRIEDGVIEAAFKKPYRISRYEINKLGKL